MDRNKIRPTQKNIKKWDSGEDIDEFERKTIVDNIVRALNFRGLKVDIR
jgi:hypothetical protein